MITSSGVPTSWNGAFISKARFEDKFKVIRKNHDELFDTYEVTVVFYASPKTEYVFEVSQDAYSGSKEVLANEILEQLKNRE